MYYVYVLRSKERKINYVGYSTDLKTRLRKHKSKGVHTTKRFGEFGLIFYECFKNKLDAQRREKYFKTTKGKRALKLMLKGTLGPIV